MGCRGSQIRKAEQRIERQARGLSWVSIPGNRVSALHDFAGLAGDRLVKIVPISITVLFSLCYEIVTWMLPGGASLIVPIRSVYIFDH